MIDVEINSFLRKLYCKPEIEIHVTHVEGPLLEGTNINSGGGAGGNGNYGGGFDNPAKFFFGDSPADIPEEPVETPVVDEDIEGESNDSIWGYTLPRFSGVWGD